MNGARPRSSILAGGLGALLVLLALVAALGIAEPARPATFAKASPLGGEAWKSCRPPLGPGDNRVHSSNLRALNISCPVARKVALSCARFTYGKSGTCQAAGFRWACSSRRSGPAGSTQRCVSGLRAMTIEWGD
jgi:hypothetical protein